MSFQIGGWLQIIFMACDWPAITDNAILFEETDLKSNILTRK